MDIKIYIAPENSWCQQLRVWLKKKRYSFEVLDLDESEMARDELLNKSNQMAIPLTDIDGEIIIGFLPDKIEAAVARAKQRS
ncbi:NrdH-redoxin [Candidatus Woesearchaeota archaeon]|nr:NrdH-redoxin [Candidatus Woesearchaeota archaeon]